MSGGGWRDPRARNRSFQQVRQVSTTQQLRKLQFQGAREKMI